MAQIGRCLMQGSSGGAVSNNWILLGSCSIIRCSQKDSIISKVTVIPSEEDFYVYNNGGHMDYTMSGTLNILPMDIYLNDNSMEKILSLKEVEDSFRVNMDTKEYQSMLLQYSNDKPYSFK